MKRNPSIAPLSRDHHFGLLFCWKIRQGIRNGIPCSRILPYIAYSWEQHLQPHFQEEEELLFPFLSGEGKATALAAHEAISRLVSSLLKNEHPAADELILLADLLDEHIRFEERILFPQAEKNLSEEILAGIGQQLVELHAKPVTENYPDEFWVSSNSL